MHEWGPKREKKSPIRETRPRASREESKNPEIAVEKVSLPSEALRAIEMMEDRTNKFKETARKELLALEKESGMSREEIKDARSSAGVLLRLDNLFLRATGLFAQFRSFVTIRFSQKKAGDDLLRKVKHGKMKKNSTYYDY